MGEPLLASSHTACSYLPKATRFDQCFTDSSLRAQPFAQNSRHTLTHMFAVCFWRGRTHAPHCFCVKTALRRWNRIYQDPSTPLKITPFHTHWRSRNKQHSATLAHLLPVRVDAGRRMGFLHAGSAAWNIVIEGSHCSHWPLIGFSD